MHAVHGRDEQDMDVALHPDARAQSMPKNPEAMKAANDLLVEDHLLAMPDEAAAIKAAHAWLADELPDGWPMSFRMGPDMSG